MGAEEEKKLCTFRRQPHIHIHKHNLIHNHSHIHVPISGIPKRNVPSTRTRKHTHTLGENGSECKKETIGEQTE